MTFFKRLVDILNHEHWGVVRSRNEMLAGFTAHYGVSFDEEFLSQVHAIEFMNSLLRHPQIDGRRQPIRPSDHLGRRTIGK